MFFRMVYIVFIAKIKSFALESKMLFLIRVFESLSVQIYIYKITFIEMAIFGFIYFQKIKPVSLHIVDFY
jgi:hypothetical protein